VQAYELLDRPEPVITISNLTSVSFTASWFTYDKLDQVLMYGTQEPLTQRSTDDRGPAVARITHHISVYGLQPNTVYYFRINGEGRTYTVKTAPQLSGFPPLTQLFKGSISTPDGTFPEESIVYMKVDGSQLRSTVSKPDGSFQLRTTYIRTADYQQDFTIKETDFVYFFVRAGFEGEAFRQLYAFSRVNPIPITLTQYQIPFYKIKFPDAFDQPIAATVAAAPTQNPSASNNPATAQPASQSLFGIIWLRLQDIF
jgi:hypothetical protein